MNNKKEVKMKRFRSLFQWGSLYVLLAVFVAVFFWEEKLMLSVFEHQLLEVGILVIFGGLVIFWVSRNETTLLDFQEYQPSVEDQQIHNPPRKFIPGK